VKDLAIWTKKKKGRNHFGHVATFCSGTFAMLLWVTHTLA